MLENVADEEKSSGNRNLVSSKDSVNTNSEHVSNEEGFFFFMKMETKTTLLFK